MIKFFIFDLGKVLIDFDFKFAVQKLRKSGSIDWKKIPALFRNSSLSEKWDKGLLSSQEFYDAIQKELRLSIQMSEFISIWNDIFTEKREMIELARFLNRKNKVFILSNTNPWHADHIRNNYQWIKEFEFIASCDVKLLKPDPEIYRLTLKKAGHEPSETIYVDDIKEYADSARTLGIDAILFKSTRQLLRELKKRNIHHASKD